MWNRGWMMKSLWWKRIGFSSVCVTGFTIMIWPLAWYITPPYFPRAVSNSSSKFFLRFRSFLVRACLLYGIQYKYQVHYRDALWREACVTYTSLHTSHLAYHFLINWSVWRKTEKNFPRVRDLLCDVDSVVLSIILILENTIILYCIVGCISFILIYFVDGVVLSNLSFPGSRVCGTESLFESWRTLLHTLLSIWTSRSLTTSSSTLKNSETQDMVKQLFNVHCCLQA